jgi:hypothetical protein
MLDTLVKIKESRQQLETPETSEQNTCVAKNFMTPYFIKGQKYRC